MSELRVVAVDDEPLALGRLKAALATMGGVSHVGSASGRAEALQLIRDRRPDVVLLDVRMRDGTGFDVVEKLTEGQPPAVIFVSAFDDHAARAFEVRAIDYILKPVGYDRLKDALNRARAQLATTNSEDRIAELKEVIASLREKVRSAPARRFEAEFWVRRNVTGLFRVPVSTIDWISADDDYVCLHSASGNHLLRETIRGVIERLDPCEYIRVHRSAVVRIGAVQEVKRCGVNSRELHLANGDRVKVGRAYLQSLKQALR